MHNLFKIENFHRGIKNIVTFLIDQSLKQRTVKDSQGTLSLEKKKISFTKSQ